MVIFTANSLGGSESYLHAVQNNVDMFRALVPALGHYSQHAVLLVASQPGKGFISIQMMFPIISIVAIAGFKKLLYKGIFSKTALTRDSLYNYILLTITTYNCYHQDYRSQLFMKYCQETSFQQVRETGVEVWHWQSCIHT